VLGHKMATACLSVKKRKAGERENWGTPCWYAKRQLQGKGGGPKGYGKEKRRRFGLGKKGVWIWGGGKGERK